MTVRIAAPSIEHHRSALGIGESAPRLSWIIQSAPSGWAQSAYEVEIARAGSEETFSVAGSDQVLVAWPDAPLRSRERARVRVRVAGADGTWSEWSPATTVEAGLLEPSDWSARPVGAAWKEDPDSDDRRPSLVRTDFEVGEGLSSARLYATAHGLYEAELNGSRVGDDALSPGWTVYPKRLRYYTYDVTDLLRPGRNAIGAWLGDGWYRGRLGWRGGFRNLFGDDLSFLGQLELTYSDGRRETVATDAAWKAAPSPILRTGIYDGEDYDARDEPAGWSSPGFVDDAWEAVAVRERDPRTLVAPTAPPVRCTEEVLPVELLTAPSGARILDFGQNLVGRVRIRVTGPAGRPCACAQPRCCRTASSTPGPFGRRARPTTTPSPAVRTARSGSRVSPSTDSATPRWTAGRAISTPRSPRETSSPGSTTPTSSAQGGSRPRIRW